MSAATLSIAYRVLDVPFANDWFARALMLLGTSINAWCDDERQPGKAGLLIADDLQQTDVTDFAERWPKGRLFAPAADLRWERLADGRLHVVLIADTPALGRLDMEGPLELNPAGKPRTLILWGEYRNNAWAEERIPDLRGLMPAHWRGPRAVLHVQEYYTGWDEHLGAFDTQRLVVRYLTYNGNATLHDDQRFPQPTTRQVP